MSEERTKILEMLSDGKIDVEQAERLLAAVGENSTTLAGDSDAVKIGGRPKFLRVIVQPKEGHNHRDNVNIKIPVMLIKAGIKLGSVLPGHSKDKISDHLKDKGLDIDISNLDSDSLDSLLAALTETSIDVDDDKETVKIFCE